MNGGMEGFVRLFGAVRDTSGGQIATHLLFLWKITFSPCYHRARQKTEEKTDKKSCDPELNLQPGAKKAEAKSQDGGSKFQKKPQWESHYRWCHSKLCMPIYTSAQE